MNILGHKARVRLSRANNTKTDEPEAECRGEFVFKPEKKENEEEHQ